MFDPFALLWALFIFLIVLAAYWDLVSFTIPNSIVIGVAVLYVPRLILSNLDPWAAGHALASAAILFLIGLFLFSRRVLGGGDVKLIAALGLWTGLTHLPRFLVVMAFAGGILAIVAISIVLIGSILRKQSPAGLKSVAAARIPYGVAIAAAGLDLAARLSRLYWPG